MSLEKQFPYLKTSLSTGCMLPCIISYTRCYILSTLSRPSFCFLIMQSVNILIGLPTIKLGKKISRRVRKVVHLLTAGWGNGKNTGLRDPTLSSHLLQGRGKARWAESKEALNQHPCGSQMLRLKSNRLSPNITQ